MYQLMNNADISKIEKQSRQGKTRNYKARQQALAKGEKFYFSGIPCVRGHLSERFTSTCNCKQCQDEFAEIHQTRYMLRKKYKITEQDYNNILISQNGVCAICRQKETVTDAQSKQIKPLSVDHCHNTKKIRGLLYTKCNIGIGYLKHDPLLLRNAAIYCEQTND